MYGQQAKFCHALKIVSSRLTNEITSYKYFFTSVR